MEENTNNLTEEVGLLADNDFEFEEEQKQEDGVVLKRTEEGLKQNFEKPENLPEEFWDDEKGTYKAEDILNAYEQEKQKALALRQKLSKGFHNVPKTPDHYEIESLSEEEINDPEGLQKFKEIAHRNGLSQEQFNSMLSDLAEEFHSEPDDMANNEERVQALYEQEMAKLGDNAEKYINSIRSWGRSLVKSQVLSPDEYKVLTNMAVRADEVKLLDKLRGVSGFISNIPEIEAIPTDHESRAEIDKILSDPNYEKDPVLQRKVENYFKRVYGD